MSGIKSSWLSLAILVVIYTVSLSEAQKGGGCFCTQVYQPVCGSDSQTYSSSCHLNCAKRMNPNLELLGQGECSFGGANPGGPGRPGRPIGQRQAPCICLANYAPVCGSDGQTYSNGCQLNCQKDKNPSLTLLSQGACNSGGANPGGPGRPFRPREAPCICLADYSPVCGSDGQTYSNGCRLGCQQDKNPSLRLVSQGECNSGGANPGGPGRPGRPIGQQPRDEPCICLADYSPVCGSDGQTYSNGCMLNCQRKKNPNLSLLGQGECNSGGANPIGPGRPGRPIGQQPQPQLPCICPANFAPVCGSDGVTYSNSCRLLCQQQVTEGLTLARQGSCASRG